jgi:hypothetical protein
MITQIIYLKWQEVRSMRGCDWEILVHHGKRLCDLYNVNLYELREKSQEVEISAIRNAMYYELLERTGATLVQIGDFMHRTPAAVRLGYDRVSLHKDKYVWELIDMAIKERGFG